MKTCSSPTCSERSSGTRLQHVARDQVKAARPRPQGDLALDPHAAYGIRAARMSTRSPRNGTPSASSSARWRAPLASEPSARTIRHHGSVGIVGRRAGRCRRSAARRGRRRRRSARTPRASRGSAPAPLRVLSSRAMRHGTYSIVALDPETGELGVAVQSHWFSRRPAVRVGARGGRRGGDAVGGRARLRPERARPARRRHRRAAGARRAAGGRPAGRRAPGRGDRHARRRRRPHRRRTASPTPATSPASTTAARPT